MDYIKGLNKIEIQNSIKKVLHWYNRVITTEGNIKEYYVFRLKEERENLDKLLDKYIKGV